MIKVPQIGQHVLNEGIYMGFKLLPGINQPLHIFSAPQNLTPEREILNFRNAAIELAGRKKWCGQNGAAFGTNWRHYESEVFKAMQAGDLGDWFIPTLPMTCGKDLKRKTVWDQSLFDLRNMPVFQKTFASSHLFYADWYFTCSENPRNALKTAVISFKSGKIHWRHKNYNHLNCRPVRVLACLDQLKL